MQVSKRRNTEIQSNNWREAIKQAKTFPLGDRTGWRHLIATEVLGAVSKTNVFVSYSANTRMELHQHLQQKLAAAEAAAAVTEASAASAAAANQPLAASLTE